MFARVSTFQGTEDGIAESANRSSDVLEKAEALSGFKGVYYLVDPESGKAMSVTLWNTEEDLRNSAEAANQIRADEATTAGSEILSVEHYQVATAELR